MAAGVAEVGFKVQACVTMADNPTNSARSRSHAATRARARQRADPGGRHDRALHGQRRRPVPDWMKGKGSGWITAEYNMLPGSTSPRKTREREKLDGRTTEIQRLIGRSLRAVADLDALGERSITVDCDVLEADGGTRTASITGAFVALVDALARFAHLPDPGAARATDSVAAVSVGIVDGQPVLDLDYKEDVAAEVDMNVVMTGGGRFVEVQGTGEEATFSEAELTSRWWRWRSRASADWPRLSARRSAPRGRFDAVRFGCDQASFRTIPRGFLLFL